jgi:hypothetical protein
MSIVLVGSTSGSITLQEPAVAGTTVLDLPAVSGTILTTTSPKAGNVLQVVSASYATQTSSTSVTFADTGLTATITPTSASSKILVLVNHNGNLLIGAPNGISWKLLRNGSQIQFVDDISPYTGGSSNTGAGSCNVNYLDSPATTSATTYKTQFSNRGATGTVVTQYNGGGGSQSTSYITLMEIAA